MPLVSYISTCMGRLEHLRRALPTWLAQPDSEVVVVDWSCPDGSGDWVKAHHAQAGVVRVPGRAHFNLAAARNAGAARASGRWLCFVDADVLLDPGFSVLVHPLLDPAAYLLSEAWMRVAHAPLGVVPFLGWALLNAAVCVWIARIGIDRKTA